MNYRALYLHIPFCRSKCLYCDFDSDPCAAAQGGLERYMGLLLERVRSCGAMGDLSSVETVYIGGGTPSLAGARLVELVGAVREFCDPVEFTCEANPESFTEDLARALRRAGATRASIGVQSLVRSELEAIGRIHGPEEALAAVSSAKRSGLSTSCDLMCGLPEQTLESWRSTLDGILSAPETPDHVSVYPLQLEEGTPLEALERSGVVEVPDEDFQAACMDMARDVLSKAGYERYEVASYAKPGYRCRHNIAYWTGVSYLGIGRSAASMRAASADSDVPLGYVSNGMPAARVRFTQLDDAGEKFDRELLTPRQAMAEDLMLSCRMTDGIGPELLERTVQVIPADELSAACERAVRQNLAMWVDGSLKPTHRGWLEGNELYGIFWDLA